MTPRPDPTPRLPAPEILTRPAPPQDPPGLRAYLRFWLTFAALFALDQFTKFWVMRHIAPDTYFDPPPIPVINGFFYFVNISNAGAAWGLFAGYSAWLSLLGLLALAAIYIFRRQLELRRPLLQYAFGLLCGGILGNLADRASYHHVVDFLDFHLPGYRYPAFNFADCGITFGVTIYLLYSFRDLWPSSTRAPSA
ncbi:MAG: signal peptidase II [Opitutales bacterium]|jgi:signal peptidase II